LLDLSAGGGSASALRQQEERRDDAAENPGAPGRNGYSSTASDQAVAESGGTVVVCFICLGLGM
jgi:hypothetical protein